MKRLIITLAVILLCGCHAEIIEPVPKKEPDMELGIRRAAVFILIMRGEPAGDKELAAEIEYIKYWISQQ